MQHAVGAGLKQQHAGEVEDQGGILRILQLLDEGLAVQEQGLSERGERTHTHESVIKKQE